MLAAGTVVRAALPLPQHADGASTARAGLPGTAIHSGVQLEVAGFALRADEVAQRAAALLQGALQHLTDGGVQPCGARCGNARRRRGGVDASGKQRFAGVDVAHANDRVPR